MKHNVLTTRKVETAKGPARLCDGMGLYLQISRFGSKAWVYRYDLGGRTREMGLGSAQAVSLRLARELAREQREHLLRGDDPIELRLAKRDRARAQAVERITFKDAAERFIALHAPTWKNAAHRKQWPNTLRDYVYPALGSRPVAAITGAVITETLLPIWMTKKETAKRVKQRIERVCQWVKDGMPLPQHGASRQIEHHPAMPFTELPAFMAELRQRDSVAASALQFTILTVARTSETIGAKWGEIDFDTGVWTIPASRMKGGKEHEVPLSTRALQILDELPREHGGYLFPGAKADKPLSNMAMRTLLRGMRPGLSTHGFRSSFRDWSGDRTHYPREVIEHALAHRIKDKAEASYRRSTALEKRRRLMQAWADYCEAPATDATVTTLRRA